MGFAPGDSMNDFKKIELDLFNSLGCLEISDFRNVPAILKERESFLIQLEILKFTEF